MIYDIIWYGTIRNHMILYEISWYDVMWCDMIWYDTVWYDIWYDMIWYDMNYIVHVPKYVKIYIIFDITQQYSIATKIHTFLTRKCTCNILWDLNAILDQKEKYQILKSWISLLNLLQIQIHVSRLRCWKQITGWPHFGQFSRAVTWPRASKSIPNLVPNRRRYFIGKNLKKALCFYHRSDEIIDS